METCRKHLRSRRKLNLSKGLSHGLRQTIHEEQVCDTLFSRQDPQPLSCNQIITCETVEYLGFDDEPKNFARDAGEAY